MKKPEPIVLDSIRQRTALDNWLAECKGRMGQRFPKIDFLADDWPIRRLYQTEQLDWYFTESMADFSDKDICYVDALRCLVAEMVIDGTPKSLHGPITAYRQLATDSPQKLFDITLGDLRRLEKRLLKSGKANPSSANNSLAQLGALLKFTSRLSRKGVFPVVGWRPHASTLEELSEVRRDHCVQTRRGKGERLDRSMEAFNEAFNLMLAGAPQLSARDQVALCVGVLLLCAPSRINEPLCMSIDDHVTVEDFSQKAFGELDEAHRAHQMLIITMKGSKGAQWSPKPILSFMIDAFHYAMGIIKSHGKRSRMLVEWYQRHPDTLYLPPELEYLRGQAISRRNLERIVRLDANLAGDRPNKAANVYFNELPDCRFQAPDPDYVQRAGRGGNRWKNIDYLPWVDVENLLLKKVQEAINRCRRVTRLNHYQGDLAKMLMLFDDGDLPAFLPGFTSYASVRDCFKGVNQRRIVSSCQRPNLSSWSIRFD